METEQWYSDFDFRNMSDYSQLDFNFDALKCNSMLNAQIGGFWQNMLTCDFFKFIIFSLSFYNKFFGSFFRTWGLKRYRDAAHVREILNF